MALKGRLVQYGTGKQQVAAIDNQQGVTRGAQLGQRRRFPGQTAQRSKASPARPHFVVDVPRRHQGDGRSYLVSDRLAAAGKYHQ